MRYALTTFTALACLFGWVFVIGQALGANIDPGQFPLGPIIAAASVSLLMGKAHLREWWRRLVTVRTAPRWYLFAFLAPIVVLVAAVFINASFGAPLPTRADLSGWPSLLPTWVFMFILIGVGEEAGWTAFAAPLALDRHPFLRAWLTLATMRTVWHIPLMIQGNLSLTIGIVGNFAFQFVVLWLFQRTGVWLLAAIWHATLNTVGGEFLFPLVEGADQDRLGLLMVAGYVLLGLAIWMFHGRRATRTMPG